MENNAVLSGNTIFNRDEISFNMLCCFIVSMYISSRYFFSLSIADFSGSVHLNK